MPSISQSKSKRTGRDHPRLCFLKDAPQPARGVPASFVSGDTRNIEPLSHVVGLKAEVYDRFGFSDTGLWDEKPASVRGLAGLSSASQASMDGQSVYSSGTDATVYLDRVDQAFLEAHQAQPPDSERINTEANFEQATSAFPNVPLPVAKLLDASRAEAIGSDRSQRFLLPKKYGYFVLEMCRRFGLGAFVEPAAESRKVILQVEGRHHEGQLEVASTRASLFSRFVDFILLLLVFVAVHFF